MLDRLHCNVVTQNKIKQPEGKKVLSSCTYRAGKFPTRFVSEFKNLLV